MTDDVGIGIVGSGVMGRIYAATLAAGVADAQLRAVSGGRGAASLAQEYAVDHVPDIESLLGRSDIDAVIIATPHSVHLEQVLNAAAAGKHVLVEKPMALDSGECRQMVMAAREAGVQLTVGHITRWMEASRIARRMIDDGDIGDVRMIQSWRGMAGGLPFPESSWAFDPNEGGPFLDWGSHGCDIMRWYAGSEAVSAFGHVVTFGTPAAVHSSAMAQFAFANGVLAQVWMTYELPHAALGMRARYVVVGSRAILDISAYGQVLRSRDDGGWDVVYRSADFSGPDAGWGYPSGYLTDAFTRQVGDLVGAVSHGAELAVTAEDGLRAVEMVEAVGRSAREGVAIRLPITRIPE